MLKKVHQGPSIYDVTHLGGGGDLPKCKFTPKAYLVKWVTRGRKGSKISKMGEVSYGWPLIN